MNLESIEKCLAKPNAKQLEKKRQNPDMFGCQTQILETPNNPIHWLMLAKHAASKIDSMSSREVVEEALRIAQKASDMLTQNMSSPHVFGKSSSTLQADMVAEALSLVCSLQSIRSDQRESRSLGYDLQHAMMICPGNGLAQALLQCSTVR
jgi:dihydroorotate dehydrogenase